MSQLRVATTPRQLPSEIDDTNRKPCRIATMICSRPAKAKQRDAPCPGLTKPEMIAASCSADARSSELEAAINRPSEETATASVTPAVWSTKLLSSQLKLRASSLRLIAPPPTLRRPDAGPRRQEHWARRSPALRARSFTLLGILGMPLDLVEAPLHPGGEAGQKAVDIPGRAVIMLRTPGSVTVAVPIAAAAGSKATNVTISRAVTSRGILRGPAQRERLLARQLGAPHPPGQPAGGPCRPRAARGRDRRPPSGTVGARGLGRPRLTPRQGTRRDGAWPPWSGRRHGAAGGGRRVAQA